MAVAGSKGEVFIWDLSCNAGVRNAFKGRTSFPIKNDEINIEVSLNSSLLLFSTYVTLFSDTFNFQKTVKARNDDNDDGDDDEDNTVELEDMEDDSDDEG